MKIGKMDHTRCIHVVPRPPLRQQQKREDEKELRTLGVDNSNYYFQSQTLLRIFLFNISGNEYESKQIFFSLENFEINF